MKPLHTVESLCSLADGALALLAALAALQALDLSGCHKLTGPGCARVQGMAQNPSTHYRICFVQPG